MNNIENFNNTIKEEINKIAEDLLTKNLSFQEWDQSWQYFGTVLYLKILTFPEIYEFAIKLIHSKVNCGTKRDKDELTNKKEGIKRFIEKLSDNNYLKNYLTTHENIYDLFGDLYKEETTEKTANNNSKKM